MTWVRYSLISTTLPRPKATLTQCLPATCATPAIVPLIRTGGPADSSARPPTSMSNGSPAFRPLATTASTAARSAMVAISTSARSCAITCCRTHVAEPERSEWSASTTGRRAARHRLLGELHALGDGMHRRRLQQRLAPAPGAGRRRRRRPCAQARACRWSSTWNVMPTSGTSAKGKPKKTFI